MTTHVFHCTQSYENCGQQFTTSVLLRLLPGDSSTTFDGSRGEAWNPNRGGLEPKFKLKGIHKEFTRNLQGVHKEFTRNSNNSKELAPRITRIQTTQRNCRHISPESKQLKGIGATNHLVAAAPPPPLVCPAAPSTIPGLGALRRAPLRKRVCVCLLCVCVCVCVLRAEWHTHTYTRTHTHTHMHNHKHTHTRTHTLPRPHSHPYPYPHSHPYQQAQPPHTNSHPHSHLLTPTHTHPHIHTSTPPHPHPRPPPPTCTPPPRTHTCQS